MLDGLLATSPLLGIAGAILGATLLLLAWVDIKTGLLPDALTLSLMWVGLLFNLDGLIAPLRSAVLGAAAGYLLLWAANRAHRWAIGRDGMGYGDFKLTAALGAWFGVALLPWIVLGACIAGWGAAMARRRAGRADRPLPFGPSLAAAGLAALGVVFSR
ncbi:prepilin peptidase [Pollutimonas bauzanensis]|uniref:Leader peptidase (Prepilin peptidase) / N-methyltransferase n=1 Tax=Pollutimonas bauzanensis TaxID=658167 RepID=A0A1M5YK50_9BURK|nr:A24 family peptidase [Pollutimonas bauzanensis]SHI12421.1 leader peptidase (prepilin peptidase) / N-methyltransferase [Pollutimonas bauzanensis]